MIVKAISNKIISCCFAIFFNFKVQKFFFPQLCNSISSSSSFCSLSWWTNQNQSKIFLTDNILFFSFKRNLWLLLTHTCWLFTICTKSIWNEMILYLFSLFLFYCIYFLQYMNIEYTRYSLPSLFDYLHFWQLKGAGGAGGDHG